MNFVSTLFQHIEFSPFWIYEVHTVDRGIIKVVIKTVYVAGM